jgi:hypothetical protein
MVQTKEIGISFWLSGPRLFNALVGPGFSLVNALTYGMRIPMKSAMHSNMMSATCSDLKPATIPK